MTQFATTRWSLILDARCGPDAARVALEEICRAYRSPVLAYVRGSGRPAADAEDLTQEFFARLLESRWDTGADPSRGRFRAFLLTALKRFLLDAGDAERALKRGGGQQRVQWESQAAAFAAPESQSPEQAFERAWAATVIERAYVRLRAEAGRAGKRALFDTLAPYLAETAESADYRRLGEALGMKPNTVAVSVHRLRLRLRELVRAEIAEQTDGEEAAEVELRALRTALLPHHQGAGGAHAAC